MDTMIRTFFRHLLESIKSLRRNGWMTVSSISAVAITLTLLGIFLTIILNTVKLAEDMENNVEVSVFISYGTTKEEQDELEKNLKAIPHVASVEFSSQDDELDRVKESYGDFDVANDEPICGSVSKESASMEAARLNAKRSKEDIAAGVSYSVSSIKSLDK